MKKSEKRGEMEQQVLNVTVSGSEQSCILTTTLKTGIINPISEIS